MNKWCVIGKGFIFPRHKESIEHLNDKIIVTCDIDPNKKADFLDWREMMQDPIWKKVTHVAICTPNYQHFEMCKAMNDKVVICEKPLTLSSKKCAELGDNVFNVLQLRWHPEVIKLKQNLSNPKYVKLVVKVQRDREYWRCWKGDESKSGGILFNLGVHYFDLLIHLLGEEYEIKHTFYSPRRAYGKIMFGKTECDYLLEIFDSCPEQDRRLEIDGNVVSLSKQDNLSFEDLHKKVYESAVFDKTGVNPSEAAKAIRLIEKLKT